MMLVLTLTILIVGQFALSRSARRRGGGGTIVSATTATEGVG